ncbi:SRPBCC family protein [Microvirga sp. ACRRW]|uniref:site-2 protease family protein n=1 Tax=Microvirga sp. ACRRW TaxID=2918205 RepID=UPI001EF42109|nr:site-2 protease family protein [Microvirga sp. ACRRW]MCG7392205.1 SRPBCC family protein [Microvirga sp. ACRRW]
MLDPDLFIAALFCAAIAGYLAFVNRPRQHYSGRFFLDVPLEKAWDLLSISPGRVHGWLPQLTSVEWSDENAGEILCRYEGGHEAYVRLGRQEAPFYEESDSIHRWNGAKEFSDLITCRMQLKPAGDGTEVELSYAVERRALSNGFFRRISYPFMVTTVAKLVRAYLARDNKQVAPARNAQPRPAAMRPVTQLILAALSFGAMCYLLGVVPGVAAMMTIVVHEYGHVHAMRRHGHDACFYLIPFFGGVAMGNRAYVSDAEASEVLLMGPAFGLMPALVSLSVFWFTENPSWMMAGFVALVVNGFNLLPVPPLDGGRIVQILLKPLGDKIWFAASGMLILLGAALAVWMHSKTFLVLLAVSAILWSLTPKRLLNVRPLTATEGLVTVAAYLALIVAHVAVALWCDAFFNGHLLRSLAQF